MKSEASMKGRTDSLAIVFAIVLTVAIPQADLSAQGSPIRVTASTQISIDVPQAPFAESHIAVNPLNPQNLIATSMLIEQGNVCSAVYVTFDGGRSWERSRPFVEGDSIFNGGDPVVYFDGEGGAWFSTLEGGFRVSRSSDGGRSWQPSVVLPGGGFDRQWLAFDNTGGPYDGNVYGAGYQTNTTHLNGRNDRSLGVVVGKLKEGGWRNAKVLSASDTVDVFWVPGDAMVTPTGRLVIPYNSWMPSAQSDSPRAGTVWTVASDNGGSGFKPAVKVGPMRRRQWSSFDSYKVLGPVRGTVDMSEGPYRGRIYLAWSHFQDGRHTVVVSHSADDGATWSMGISVRDSDATNDAGIPALAVNRDGVLAVVWYDRRDDPDNNCYDLYATTSLDGGQTFLPNIRAGEALTCPAARGNWKPAVVGGLQPPYPGRYKVAQALIMLLVVPARWPNGGDTQGLVADENGVFHAGWVNGATGVMQLWHTQFTVDPEAAPPSIGATERDYTEQVRFVVSNPLIDFATGTMSVEARIKNVSAAPIVGPFTAKLTYITNALPGLRVANADNGKDTVGAIWLFEVGDGRTVLEPGEQSAMRPLRFTIPKDPPAKPDHPLRAMFRISTPVDDAGER